MEPVTNFQNSNLLQRLEYSDDDMMNVWSVLLSEMQNNYYKTGGTGTLSSLASLVDFNDDTINEETQELEKGSFSQFLDDLIQNYKDNNWNEVPAAHWNDTWAEALDSFIKGIYYIIADKDSNIDDIDYEDSSDIYIDEEGAIAVPKSIRGGIGVKGGVPFRYKDVKNADAGANFCKVNELYSSEHTGIEIDSDVNITYEFKHMNEVERYFRLYQQANGLNENIEELQQAFNEEYLLYKDIYDSNSNWLRPYDSNNQVYGNIDMDNRPTIQSGGSIETVLGGSGGPYYIENKAKYLSFTFSSIAKKNGAWVILNNEGILSYLSNIIDNVIDWDSEYDADDQLNYEKLYEDILDYDNANYKIIAKINIGVVGGKTDEEIVEEIKSSKIGILAQYLHYVGKYGALQIIQQEIADVRQQQSDYIQTAENIHQQYFSDCSNVELEYKKYQEGSNGYFRKVKTLNNINLFYRNGAVYSFFDKKIYDNYECFIDNGNFFSTDRVRETWYDTFENVNDNYYIIVHCDEIPKRYYILTSPWVIPWYNINGDSYATVRGVDKCIAALSNDDKLDFTKSKTTENGIRLLMPRNTRNIEIEDLNRNFWVIAQVVSAMSAYLFDENGPIPKSFKDLIGALTDIWENVEYLWLAVAAIGQKPYCTKTVVQVIPLPSSELQPYIKFDNFEITAGSWYQTMRDAAMARLGDLKQSYTDCNLVILPEIRLDNYEKNYYSHICYPGLMVLNRNLGDNWTWDSNFNGYDIDLVDNTSHRDYTYVIRENDEETYKYFAPFNRPNIIELNARRYYELLRPIYDINTEVDEETDEITCSVDIKFYDAAAQLINDEVNIIWDNGTWVTPEEAPDEVVTITDIEKGYYQGELLSYYRGSESLNYLAQVVYVELEPKKLTDQVARQKDYQGVGNRVDEANEVLTHYFMEQYIENEPTYSPDKLYIVFGHFYYKGFDDGESTDSLTYWKMQGGKATEVTQAGYHRGSQGIDVGMVLFRPNHHDTPIAYGGPGAYWSYSAYYTDSWGGSGNSSYRIEIYTKDGRIVDDDSWYARFISLVALSHDIADAVPTELKNYAFHHSHNNEKWFTTRRIFSYYLDGHGHIKEIKREKEDITDPWTDTITGTFPVDTTKYNTRNIQLGVKIQGNTPKLQLLNKNEHPDFAMYSDIYPEYETHGINGYNK